uniref:Uncharacterized protein n=1 Tax=Megaselia scalaris TaxID=36166 RepID=T1H0L0_MEGSC
MVHHYKMVSGSLFRVDLFELKVMFEFASI